MSDQQHPSLPPDLSGAIDLTDPVQICLANFKQLATEQRVKAIVLIGLTDKGDVALSFHAPSGAVQALGMLAAADAVITSKELK